MEKKFFHSVTLNKDSCKGCTNCIKRCPTEAIRVQNGKAKILSDRCIDCGECIRVCPHHAKQATSDKLEVVLNQFSYTIALPAPSLYGQFNHLDSIDPVLNGLIAMGFDEVFEVSRAAELVSDATRRFLGCGTIRKPVISSACPTITRLIRVRFPDLLDHILPLLAPAELAARLAKQAASRKTGLAPDQIGTVFLSPCPAKVTSTKMTLGTRKSEIDAVVAIKDVYPRLLSHMKHQEIQAELSSSGRIGIGWGSSGGEAAAMFNERYLAADGIENCIRVLEDLEDDKLGELDFVELNSCPGGCVGGVLTVENPYIAKVKLKHLRQFLPVSCNRFTDEVPAFAQWDLPVEYEPVMELDADLSTAMEKMAKIDEITDCLPGLDCGSCGSPSCRSLAEDIVRGYTTKDACIFILKESMLSIAESLARLGRQDFHFHHDEESEGPSS